MSIYIQYLLTNNYFIMEDVIISICATGSILLGGVIFLLISLITYLRPQIYCRRYSVEFLSLGLIFLGIAFLLCNSGNEGIIEYSMLVTGPAGGAYILYLLAKKPDFYEKRRLVILLGVGFIIFVVAFISMDSIAQHNIEGYLCSTTRILEALTIGNSVVQGFVLIVLGIWLRRKYYTKRLHNGIYEGCNCPRCAKEDKTVIEAQ